MPEPATSVEPPPQNPLGRRPPDGDSNRGPALNVIVWLFASISTILYLLRIYTRRWISKTIGLEDAIMTLALVIIFVESGIVSHTISLGLARHQYFLGLAKFSDTMKWQAIAEPLGILGPCVPKLVVTILLIKILAPSTWAIVYLWSLNALLISISIVCSVIVFAQCTPVSAQWTRMGKCWDPKILTRVSLAQGSFASFTDFALATFPVATVWKLQMRLEKRIGVCLLMGLGGFAGIAAAVKTSQLPKLNAQADITWELFTLVLWVMLELNIVFICACIPVLRPLWRKYLGSDSTLRGSDSRYKWYKGSSGGYMFHSKDNRRGQANDASSSRKNLSRLETGERNHNDSGTQVTSDIEMT